VEELTDVETLAQIAAATGGRAFIGTNRSELEEAVEKISEDLRSQYLVGFTPTGKGVVKYRAISLKLPRGVRSVRVRSGYRGTEPPVYKRGARGK
jgi:VWFA-related protein